MKLSLGITLRDYSVAGGITYDADAQAFFTAASITDSTQKSAVNTLVLSLKSANIWTKMKALYPVVGGVASSHAVNLKTPGTYNLSFATGWTHASTGMTPNGATYADTNLIPSSVLTLNSSHFSFYSRTNIDSAGIDFGATSNPGNNGSLYANLKASNNVYFRVNTNNTTQTESSVSVSDSRKFYVLNRILSTTETIFINGVVNNVAKNSSVQPTIKIYLGSLNFNNVASYSGQRQCAFASIGEGLTDTDATNFYNAVQTFQTTLGRQV